MADAPPGTVHPRPTLPAGSGEHRAAAALAVRAIRVRAGRRPWIVAWLAFLPVVILRAGILTEGDTFWEIRTGLLTIAHRAIPTVDTFSWTMRGRPWTLNSWGFNVLDAVAYRMGGLLAVAWMCAGLAMALAAVVLLLAKRLGARPTVAGAALLVTAPFTVIWLTPRPQLIDYIAVLVLIMLLRAITAGRARGWAVAAIAILSVVWVNLHAGALFGVLIAGGCATVLLLRRDTRASGWWCAGAAGAALAGSFVNPYGVGIISQTEQVRAASAGLIVEWRHVNPASPLQDLSLALGLLALVLVIRRGNAPFIAALTVAEAGAVIATRFLPFVVLTALPVLAAWASHLSPAILRYARSRRVMLVRCGTAGLAALAMVTAPSLTHIGRPDLAKYPISIISDIPSGCRLFNTDLIGSYVILVRPDVPVSLDTRNTLYGRRRLVAMERVLAGRGDLARGLAGAGCVLVPPRSGLARRLRTDPGWSVRASDTAAILFIRRL